MAATFTVASRQTAPVSKIAECLDIGSSCMMAEARHEPLQILGDSRFWASPACFEPDFCGRGIRGRLRRRKAIAGRHLIASKKIVNRLAHRVLGSKSAAVRLSRCGMTWSRCFFPIRSMLTFHRTACLLPSLSPSFGLAIDKLK
jgi:hypothetical protein